MAIHRPCDCFNFDDLAVEARCAPNAGANEARRYLKGPNPLDFRHDYLGSCNNKNFRKIQLLLARIQQLNGEVRQCNSQLQPPHSLGQFENRNGLCVVLCCNHSYRLFSKRSHQQWTSRCFDLEYDWCGCILVDRFKSLHRNRDFYDIKPKNSLIHWVALRRRARERGRSGAGEVKLAFLGQYWLF